MAVLADLVTLVLALAMALVYDPDALDLSSPRLPLALLILPAALLLGAATRTPLAWRPHDACVALAFLMTLAGAMLSPAPWASGPAFALAGLAAGAYLVGRRAGTRRALLPALAKLCLAALGFASVLLLGAFARPEGADLATGAPTRVLVGPLGNPDYLAGWLVLTLPAAALGGGGAPALVCGVIALAWTLSRGAALGLAAAALVVYRPRALAGRRAAVTAIAAVLATGYLAAPARDTAKLASPTTLTRRLAIWRAGVALVAARPLTGHGPGRWPAVYEAARPADPLGPGRMPPSDFAHDLPLQIAVEHGLFGLALFAAALGIALWRGRGLAAPDADPLARALACGLSAFVLHNLVSVTAYVVPVLVMAALWAGALVTRLDGSPPPSHPRAYALMGVLAALVTFMVAPWGLSRNRALHEAGLARTLLARGRAADALPHARAALAEDPDVVAVRYVAAGALAEAGEARAALVQYLLLGAQEPAYGEQDFDRARVLLDLKRPRAARASLERAVATDPGSFRSWYLLGRAAYEAGDRAASREAVRRARAVAPTPALEHKMDELARSIH